MNNKANIQAGALQFVVFISVVIAILLAAFVVLTHTHTFFKKQSDAVVETVKKADAGIQYALVKDIALNDSTGLPFFKENKASVRVYRDYWGVFEKITAVSGIGNKKFTKIALTGRQFAQEDRPALYLQDQHKPLILVGDTRIEGTVYVPEKAVRPGNISGHAYQGSVLVSGAIKKSGVELPLLPQELLTHLRLVSRQEIPADAEVRSLPSADGLMSRSFTQSAPYIYSPGTLDLNGLKISGNITVYAGKKIIVTASSQLHDVVLAAPEIEIRDGVQGRFQAIASEKIGVGKNVLLHYPSALAVLEEEPEEEHQISIGENTIVKGIVLFLGEEKPNNFSPQVTLESGAAICGELYCDQNIALKGRVEGSVYTANFIVQHSGSVYQNHIFNGTISGKNLPKVYAGLSPGTTKKSVIQWLY